MSGPLAGERALVSAGGSGIGRVIAERLAEAGARCMVCDVDAATLDEFASTFGAGLGIRADVADEAQVDVLFAQVEERLGGLDILINNAGISGPTLPAEQLSLCDWRRTLAVNLDGHFLCARRRRRRDEPWTTSAPTRQAPQFGGRHHDRYSRGFEGH